MLQIADRRCIWLDRDSEGYLRLNFAMPSFTPEPRAYIVANGWVVPPGVDDLECPPRGRTLGVTYANGDRFRVEFFECADAAHLAARVPMFRWADALTYPLTVVNLWETAVGSPLEFGPTMTRLPGATSTGSFMSNCGVGIMLDGMSGVHLPPPDEEEGGQ
jgi:hypothetical protein